MTNEKIVVLILCYNEELTIKAVVKDFKNVILEADIYLYYNNSTDNTAQIAKEIGAIVVLEHIDKEKDMS